MNKEQAKAWLPLIQAVADGKTIQLNICTMENPIWRDAQGISAHSDLLGFYRIKPEPKKQWYRVGVFKNGFGDFASWAVANECAEQEFERGKNFVYWLTSRIEYELPEGEA